MTWGRFKKVICSRSALPVTWGERAPRADHLFEPPPGHWSHAPANVSLVLILGFGKKVVVLLRPRDSRGAPRGAIDGATNATATDISGGVSPTQLTYTWHTGKGRGCAALNVAKLRSGSTRDLKQLRCLGS